MAGKYETKPNVNATGGEVGKYWARGYHRRKREKGGRMKSRARGW